MKARLWIAGLMGLSVAVWSVYGFGGPTLVKLLENKAGLSLLGAAATVSILVGVLGTFALFPETKRPTANEAKQSCRWS